MGGSFFFFVTLTACFCSIGSLTQTSYYESDKISQSTGRNPSGPVNLSTEAIFHSESSVVESRYNGGSMVSLQLNNETVSPKEPEGVSSEDHSGSGIALTMRPALTDHQSGSHDQEHDTAKAAVSGHHHPTRISEDAIQDESYMITEESTVKYDLLTGLENFKFHIITRPFTSLTSDILAVPGEPCGPGVTACNVFTNFNGTRLLWDDMKRTLAFAWELHVFGSASLFTLLAVLAVLGMAGACTLPHPLRNALTLSNGFLIISGAMRTAFLLLDPYGTRQILPHATLAALHNVPLQLLLWTQVILTLVTLRGLKLLFFPLKLQRPWVVGWLGIFHCTILLLADLYSSKLSPALPFLLQTLSLCWGIPFCLGILTKSLFNLQPFVRSSVPQLISSQKTERLGKRVIAVCAFVGVLCCSLQMYSLLWLYGLLGNWRHFGWGWWIIQFWSRILELAWGLSLLFLGSWIFWAPCRGQGTGDHENGRGEVSKQGEEKSLWCKILASMEKGQLRKSDKSWEDLLPNNWKTHNLPRTGINNNAMCLYDDETTTNKPEYIPDPVSSSSSDSQTALLWHKVGDRECVLSLVEFDMRPPSPINLRRSIDNALYHGQLVAGGLFTPPPLSWNNSRSTDRDNSLATFPPVYIGHRWLLDTESLSASLDQFQTNEPTQLLRGPDTLDHDNGSRSPPCEQKGELSADTHHRDWSEDDITDL
ncbi:proline-rich transmembrane protein 3-like [Cololabis saira]|uniref:proline-rich transmembrane protein 3-like n=1 Tax=Cololabis saira TaxID=129043 RepID=UPI002AD26FE6|nr:proline-rich transmembrane protein 3-like [Cololabis saira]